MSTTVTRPALRYHGGKWRIADWIIAHFPPHTCYVEPFGGAASVLLRKAPSLFEVYNDRDEVVVTFFRVLRERPQELIRAIELTPYSRAEQQLAYTPCDDELEQARRLCVRAWQTYGGPRTSWRSGWRFQHSDNAGASVIRDWNATEHLWEIVGRLKQVQIECDEALAVVRRYDRSESLFYVDPPYPMSTRSQRWNRSAYQHELSDDDHRSVAEALHRVDGMVLVSGYRCDLYDQIYGDWQRVVRQTINMASSGVTECLWLNPAAQQRARQTMLGMESAS